jgi:hypothetical protein
MTRRELAQGIPVLSDNLGGVPSWVLLPPVHGAGRYE